MSMRNQDMAREFWGAEPPEYVLVLAERCDSTSQAQVAIKLGYSNTAVNQVLRKKYTGSYEAMERAVGGAFQNAKVNCPVLGEIAMRACLENQRKPYSSINSTHVRLYRNCNGGCTHSLKKKPKEAA